MPRFSPLVFSSLLAAIAGCGIASSDSSSTFASSDSGRAGPSCGLAGASAKGNARPHTPPSISDASGGTSPVGLGDTETNRRRPRCGGVQSG